MNKTESSSKNEGKERSADNIRSMNESSSRNIETRNQPRNIQNQSYTQNSTKPEPKLIQSTMEHDENF